MGEHRCAGPHGVQQAPGPVRSKGFHEVEHARFRRELHGSAHCGLQPHQPIRGPEVNSAAPFSKHEEQQQIIGALERAGDDKASERMTKAEEFLRLSA